MYRTPALLVVSYGAPQRLGRGRMEIFPGQFSQALHARVLACRFDLVRHVQHEGEWSHPGLARGVGPNSLQNLSVFDAELAPCQLRRDRPVQELWALPLRFSDGKIPFLRKPQEVFWSGLARRVVYEG